MLSLSSSPAGKLRAAMDEKYSAAVQQDQLSRGTATPGVSTVKGSHRDLPGAFVRRERVREPQKATKIFAKFPRGSFGDGVVTISSTSVVELLGASPSPGDARRVFP
jgi:hypothetical protein